MYKSLCSTLIIVSVAYFFSIHSDLLPFSLNSINPNIAATPFQNMALSSVSRSVAKKVLSVETPEGAGALVRRSIGTANLKNLTPFLMLDHFHVAKGAVSPSVGNH